LWPGALPAAAAPVKQPTEVVIRQVKSTAANVLQLSPADQLKLVGLADSGPSAAGEVLTPAAINARLQQLQAAAASKTGVVASTAHSRGELQAAAARLAEQQVGCCAEQTLLCLAEPSTVPPVLTYLLLYDAADRIVHELAGAEPGCQAGGGAAEVRGAGGPMPPACPGACSTRTSCSSSQGGF
jgi:hypothetical protein